MPIRPWDGHKEKTFPDLPGRHVSGPLRALADAIARGDRHAAASAWDQLRHVGYALERAKFSTASEPHR